jgi:hypothetical protein
VKTVALLLLLAMGWLALMPPFFTHGACTAEFDAAGNVLQVARAELATLSDAQAWLKSHALAYQVLAADRCESQAPPEVQICPGGPLILITVPVQNRVCRYYRDSSIRQVLGYNALQQLVHMQTDMHPFRMLKLPFFDFELSWAR